MKRINKLFNPRLPVAILLSTVVLASCTKKFDEINTDRNAIATVGASELPFLFAKAEQTSIPNIWNYQVAQNLFADQYAQYFACTATYFPSDRLNIRMDWVGAAFNPIYTDLVPQLQSIFQASEPGSPEYALSQVVWVLGFHRVTDYWGPIPYFNAGVPGKTVPYDAQDKIYDDFFKKLDSAANVLKSNPSAAPFGSFDLIYGGNVTKWLHFTNSLRLRLALRISKVDPARAKAEAEAAVAGGVMQTSPDEDAYIKKSLNGADNNGLSIMSDWNEFRMSAAMESVMNGYKDPRESVYWLPAGADQGNPAGTGKYEGLRNGLTSTQLTENINKPTSNSKVGKRWSSPAFAGNADYLTTPLNVMSVAESYFNRAEGAVLGWNMGGDAKTLYEEGIRQSMHQWGITDEAAITAYLNSSAVPVAPNDYLNSPAVSTAPIKYDGTRAKEQIAIQKWLAMFPDGNEAWSDYRRGRNFILYPVANSENADIPNPTTQWIRRIPFLLSETQNNKAAVEAAVPLLGAGGDKVTTPLWWDKN
ncbi:MAG TPA: SusD/RagB family nutrient-binding outer membrane lipoprotein [Panacibacter sp.]|nr:SusD/RagB family nutrient-binding outer membrane lipoprotein [Panacibacter sp.]HNP44849.1 SusD/RagB family nutrient-binding outer membrane lipoprotein [Panacibacter sp.]